MTNHTRVKDKGIHPFFVDKLDPLAQGQSQEAGCKAFVAKTLPGERGVAKVYRSKLSKGEKLFFSSLTSPSDLQKKSPLRTKSTCPHYDQCFGCDYLHTDYQSELRFKREALEQSFASFSLGPISTHLLSVIPAKEREFYRNRVQLHYDRAKKHIGLMRPSGDILPVPKCHLPQRPLAAFISQTIEKGSWLSFIPAKDKDQGHLEFQLINGEVSVSCNQPYSHGGFRQVHDQMNEELCKLVSSLVKKTSSSPGLILDLFGGDGNLTRGMKEQDVLVADVNPKVRGAHQSPLKVDLTRPRGILELFQVIGERKVSGLILDPPRRGYSLLASVVEKLAPEWILYTSCHPRTLSRDLKTLPASYELQNLALLDFFPGTKHFESVAFLVHSSFNKPLEDA